MKDCSDLLMTIKSITKWSGGLRQDDKSDRVGVTSKVGQQFTAH